MHILRRIPLWAYQWSIKRTSHTHVDKQARVRLHPGHQYTIEEIAQGIPERRKHEIEQLYEFEKLEINDQSVVREQYRHHIKRSSLVSFYRILIHVRL
jgi:hypothetical protein